MSFLSVIKLSAVLKFISWLFAQLKQIKMFSNLGLCNLLTTNRVRYLSYCHLFSSGLMLPS